MKLPRWMNRSAASALFVVGVLLVSLALWAYSSDVVGSFCGNGELSESTGPGTCSYNDGVDNDRGDDGKRVVDTVLGLRIFSWIGATKWPAFVLGTMGAITGLIGLGATSALAFLPTTSRTRLSPSADPNNAAPKPIEELDIFAGSYLELTVKIDEKPKGYAVEVTTPMAQTRRVLRNTALPQDRGVQELTSLAAQVGKRRFGSKQSKAVEAFGTNLFHAVFSDAGEHAFRDSIDFVREHNAVLRIVLQVDETFADIPWEYLYDPKRGAFLSRSQETSLVRVLPTNHATRTQSDITTLRILSMAASPRQTEQLDIATEQQLIRDVLAASLDTGQVALEFVDGGTFESLSAALRSFKPHVFHFAGHGEWDLERDDGVILFEDAAGLPQRRTGVDLGTLLNQSDLRLAIFNSCHGATPSKNDRFAGITSSLVAQGVPAAIGMQFAFDDKAAITFSSTLMGELGAGATLDQAVTDARIAVFTQRKGIEWGTPVLTTRVPLDEVIPRC